MNQQQIREFLENYATGELTDDEHQEFIDWLKHAPISEVEAIAEEYGTILLMEASKAPDPELVSTIETALDQWDLGTRRSSLRVVRINSIYRIAAAAVFIGILFLSYWLFMRDTGASSEPQKMAAIQQDVPAPATTRATIILADGRSVALDSLTALTEAGVVVKKNGDEGVSYERVAINKEQILFNTLSNPRGSKVVSLTLSDGTKVWLNAGSSLKYPTAFNSIDREVEITGEAYFEVAKSVIANRDPSSRRTGSETIKQAFLVKAHGTTTEVLGTHFNVNAYDDESAVRVTLLEGSVRTAFTDGASAMLKPGQQGILSNSGTPAVQVLSNVNIESVMGWKNGVFSFRRTDIKNMMRQIARWYNVEVSYQGSLPDETITGEVPRTANVSEVLKMLEYAGFHFSIKGNAITVKP